ncbi:phage major tail tube protein [Stenotrophomonas lactitubi]|uniref:phage major tail tube protein n=1 Tax=Stenotrophomonas lactitubi TaxID=2045214 RepID=UPI00203B1EB8|nr:phage major tail tube protein [Stenotrophomonas lactitubi]
MGLPRKLKGFNTFTAGESFLGEAKTITLPELKRIMEAYRGGGMSGPVKIDLGQDEIQIKVVYGGLMRPILRQYAETSHDGVQIRFAGGYQRDDNGQVDAVEVVIRGRHEGLEFGDSEAGSDTEFTVTTACSYYKLTWNGEVLIELDLVNMVENVGGIDRLLALRSAIGA